MMVQAILEGRKTMTRRVVKPQPDDQGLWNHSITSMALDSTLEGWWGTVDETGESKRFNDKYGVPGDVLWVRETFCKMPEPDSFGEYLYKSMEDKPYGKWKPGIHMPKAACRIFLKVKRIRVERLQEITKADAIAEGIEELKTYSFPIYKNYLPGAPSDGYQHEPSSFRSLWKKINGEASWNENPFVWVIEFERIDKPENFN